ncbi:MAG: hypothetical protein D6680_10620 [Cyanobacteria bacterium J007]|nr:MAG: hypothetical protein D6680_10620 [Cyanobacteria bacterium J007]
MQDRQNVSNNVYLHLLHFRTNSARKLELKWVGGGAIAVGIFECTTFAKSQVGQIRRMTLAGSRGDRPALSF